MKFSHSGLIGDIVYHLPIMKELGGGELFINPFTDILWENRHVNYNHRGGILFDSILPLLEAQPYLTKVSWSDTPIGMCFEGWRRRYVDFNMNLTRQAAMWLAMDIPDDCPPWLEVPDAKQVAPVIICRANRHLHAGFPWKRVLEKFQGKVAFVGFAEEYRTFTAEHGHIPHHPTSNMLEVAQAIKGSNLFVGTASSPAAVAEGLKHNAVIASYPPISHCAYFNRPNMQHCWEVVHLDLFDDEGRSLQ